MKLKLDGTPKLHGGGGPAGIPKSRRHRAKLRKVHRLRYQKIREGLTLLERLHQVGVLIKDECPDE